jgi:hypothetical protein
MGGRIFELAGDWWNSLSEDEQADVNAKVIHVRVPRRMNQIGVRPRKAWSEFLQ